MSVFRLQSARLYGIVTVFPNALCAALDDNRVISEENKMNSLTPAPAARYLPRRDAVSQAAAVIDGQATTAPPSRAVASRARRF